MMTKTLLAMLALGTLLAVPLAAAGTQIEKLPPPKNLGDSLPGARVHWPGTEAQGETVGVLRATYAGSSKLEVDDRCASGMSAGLEAVPMKEMTIPSTHKGTKVVGSRITTDLDATGGVVCLVVLRHGQIVHRGLAGEWSTPGSFKPGDYRFFIGAPGDYRFSVEVELVAT